MCAVDVTVCPKYGQISLTFVEIDQTIFFFPELTTTVIEGLRPSSTNVDVAGSIPVLRK